MELKTAKSRIIAAIIIILFCVFGTLGLLKVREKMLYSDLPNAKTTSTETLSSEEMTEESETTAVSTEESSEEETDITTSETLPESTEASEGESSSETVIETESSEETAKENVSETTKKETTAATEETTKKPVETPGPKYKIMVNKKKSVATIYTKDDNGEYTIPVKACVCSCGVTTPLTTFPITSKIHWCELFGNLWGQYCSRLGSYDAHLLIHSVPYYQPSPGTLETPEYDKLGSIASAGCVRMSVEDCIWIYNNCETGTKVVIYESDDIGPLGKPVPKRIGDAPSPYKHWDPTDPNDANPWKKVTESIELTTNEVTIKYGEEIDLTKFVKSASNSLGQKVGYSIRGKVDNKHANTYRITYLLDSGKGEAVLSVKVLTKEKPTETAERSTETTEKPTESASETDK